VVKHFHYVLRIGKVFGIIKGIQNWTILIFGFKINQKLSFIKKIILFLGVNLTFFPIHFKGLKGIPRRYIDFKDIYTRYNNISNNGSNLKRFKLFLFVNNFLFKYLKNKKIIKINKNPFLIEWITKIKKRNFNNTIKIVIP
jgi:heme/copper-type cytochrome/quinol oxidase subunit 1